MVGDSLAEIVVGSIYLSRLWVDHRALSFNWLAAQASLGVQRNDTSTFRLQPEKISGVIQNLERKIQPCRGWRTAI